MSETVEISSLSILGSWDQQCTVHRDVLIEPILSPSSQGCGVIPGVRSDTSPLSQLHCVHSELTEWWSHNPRRSPGKYWYWQEMLLPTERDPKQNMGLLIRIQMKCAYILWDQCRVQACIALGWMRGNEPITPTVHSRMLYLSVHYRNSGGHYPHVV